MKHNGRMIKLISKELEINKNNDLKKYDMTAQQFHVIMLISLNSDKKIFQKDIEKDMDITGATASGILSRLEAKGYITRKTLDNDSRYKYLNLTNKALELKDKIFVNIEKHEKIMTQGFSEEEKKTLMEFLERMLNNLQKEKEYK